MSRTRWPIGLQIVLPLVLLVLFASPLPAQNFGFVVDNSQGAVRILDLTERAVQKSIPVCLHPTEMLILPNNRTAFVSCPDSNFAAVLDLQDQVLVGTVETGQGPGSLIGSPDGRFVYIANEASNDLTVIDAVAQSVLETIPVGTSPIMVNLSPGGRYLYVVNQDEQPTGTVSVIDTNRRALIKTIKVGLQPVQFALSPDSKTAYVVNTGSNEVSIVDLTTNEVTGQIPVGQAPSGVAFSTNGATLYVINRGSNNITVVNTSDHSIVGQIPVGQQPTDLVVTFDSRFGFISNQGSNNVTLLDLSARTAELSIPTGSRPFDLALEPNEDFLYVTNLDSNSVTVIDVNQDRVVATIPLQGVPVQFTQYNAPTLLELAPNPAPAGSSLILNGESLLPSSKVHFVTTAPPRTVIVDPVWLDSQGLRVTVPSMQGSSVVVSVHQPDRNSSEQITLRFGSSSSFVSAGGVVEGAAFQPAPYPVSGGSIVSVFGSFAGVSQAAAASFPLPTSLGNARVTINGAPAPLLFTSTGQVNVITPPELSVRSNVRVAVTAGTQTSAVETVSVEAAGPGLFQVPTTGFGAVAHGSRPADLVTASDPAERGETLILYATGLGPTFPEGLKGEAVPGDVLAQTVVPVVASVGGVPAVVEFSGLTPGFSGLYQINLIVPTEAPVGDNVPVDVQIGTVTSSSVRLAVR